MDPERLGGKRLGDYDVIVAMESRHRDYVLSLCPECRDKVVVWNVRDLYFMDREDAVKFMSRLERRLRNWLSRSEVQSMSQTENGFWLHVLQPHLYGFSGK